MIMNLILLSLLWKNAYNVRIVEKNNNKFKEKTQLQVKSLKTNQTFSKIMI